MLRKNLILWVVVLALVGLFVAAKLDSEKKARELREMQSKSVKSLTRAANKAAAAGGIPADPLAPAPATQEAPLSPAASLHALLDRNPQFWIAEVGLLEPGDWAAVADKADLDSDEGRRLAFNQLRRIAKIKLAPQLQAALKAYVKDHSGNLPGVPQDLRPYLPESVSPEILGAYVMRQSGALADVQPRGTWLLSRVGNVDETYDDKFNLQLDNFSTLSAHQLTGAVDDAVTRYYRTVGRLPTESAQLIPFLDQPVDGKVLEMIFTSMATTKSK